MRLTQGANGIGWTLRRSFALGLAALTLAAASPPPTVTYAQPDVAEQNGNIVYYDRLGSEHPLTRGGKFVQPELSPDGRLAAFIKVEVEGEPAHGVARTSLWIAAIPNGKPRLLLPSTPAEGMTENLAAMWKPRFSLNGGFVYVMAEAWATSSAIHQVNVRTGAHRYVIDGELLFVLTGGRHAGWLAVQRHRYPANPENGAIDPVYIVRPDGKQAFMVPGSDKDNGETSLPAWLRANSGRRK